MADKNDSGGHGGSPGGRFTFLRIINGPMTGICFFFLFDFLKLKITGERFSGSTGNTVLGILIAAGFVGFLAVEIWTTTVHHRLEKEWKHGRLDRMKNFEDTLSIAVFFTVICICGICALFRVMNK